MQTPELSAITLNRSKLQNWPTSMNKSLALVESLMYPCGTVNIASW
jgi:hypothetical protein